METIQLQLTHTFGSTCSLNFKNCLAICDQDKNQPKIVFPAGKTLARKYIDRAEMDFVQFSQTTQFVQCITVLPTKTHCAVVQKPFHSSLQLIKIYKMDQKAQPHTIKIFSEPDKVGIIKDIVFSPSQPKFMCAFLGQPHNKLIFIDTSRNKPLAQSNFTISNIEILTICPQNSHLICLSGGNFLKLFKIEQYAFKPLEEIRKFPKGRTITGHAWYQGKKIIAATDKCEILLIEQIKSNVYEVRQEYHNVFNEQTYDNIRISCICPFSKGFILGSNLGKFCLWTRKEDLINTPQGTQKLQLTRKWATTAQRQAQVNSISINRKQDLLLISLSNNDIALLSLNQIIPQISDMLKQTQQKQINFQYLYKGFHSKPITGMSICQQRPLFATISSQDSTIRVWNYKSPSCKLLRMFYFKIKTELSQQERPLITLAFHPSGYYMAVGCSDKLRMFHVMNNELRPFKEVGIRQVRNVRFSNGGQFLAVGQQFTDELEIDYLRVYNALTLQEVFVYKENQAYIKQINWKSYDQVLSCLYENGTLVQFRVLDWSISKKVTRKQLQFCASTFNQGSNSTIVYSFNKSSKSNLLQQYFPQPNTPPRTLQIDLEIQKMLQIPLTKQRSCFLLALSNGTLVTLNSIQSHSISSYQNHHIGGITEMVLSPCGGYLITCGRDALVFVYEVGVISGNGVVKREIGNGGSVVDDFLGDVVLVNKRQVQKYSQKQKEFTKVISSLSKKLKILSEQGEKKHLKNMSQLQIQKNRIIQDIRYRISKVTEQIQQLKQKNNSSLSQLDTKGITHIQLLQKNYQDKISFQQQKYFQLQQELIQLKVLHQKKLEGLHKEEEDMVAQLKREFQSKFRQSQSIFSQTKHQTHQATNIFQLRLQQIQQQQQQQIRQLEAKRHKFKLQTAALLQQLHQKLQKLKKQYSTLQKQRTQVKLQNQELLFQKKKLQKQSTQAKDKLKDLLFDFDQKLQSLKNKQQKILQFQQKVNQLQKKKHILSYKATQMKKAIQPKDFQIQKLKSDLIKLKKQFQASLQRKQKANLYLKKINKEKQYLDKCYNQQKQKTQEQSNPIDQVLMDIYFCLQKNRAVGSSSQPPTTKPQTLSSSYNPNPKSPQLQQPPYDHKIYFKQLIRLYHKYVQNQSTGPNPSFNSDKSMDEVTKQIVHLEKSLFQINKSNQKNIIRKNDEIFKRTKENTELINNLNQLKKQNKEFILKIKSKNLEIEGLKAVKVELLNSCPKTSGTLVFKLMNGEGDVGGNDMVGYSSVKKVGGNSLLGSSGNNNNINTHINNSCGLNTRQKSVRQLALNLSGQQPFLKPQAPSLKPQLPNPNYKKRQCQIISQIQFISQRVHKFQFYLKDMEQKLRRHVNLAGCEVGRSIVESFVQE